MQMLGTSWGMSPRKITKNDAPGLNLVVFFTLYKYSHNTQLMLSIIIYIIAIYI